MYVISEYASDWFYSIVQIDHPPYDSEPSLNRSICSSRFTIKNKCFKWMRFPKFIHQCQVGIVFFLNGPTPCTISRHWGSVFLKQEKVMKSHHHGPWSQLKLPLFFLLLWLFGQFDVFLFQLEDTVDGRHPKTATWHGAKNPVNKGINWTNQVVSRISAINSTMGNLEVGILYKSIEVCKVGEWNVVTLEVVVGIHNATSMFFWGWCVLSWWWCWWWWWWWWLVVTYPLSSLSCRYDSCSGIHSIRIDPYTLRTECLWELRFTQAMGKPHLPTCRWCVWSCPHCVSGWAGKPDRDSGYTKPVSNTEYIMYLQGTWPDWHKKRFPDPCYKCKL